jgi:hypothetical protein
MIFYPSLVVNLEIRFDEAAMGLNMNPKTVQDLAKEVASWASPPTDGLTEVLGIVPRSASVEFPGYRSAGNFDFEIEYKDLPIDSRLFRAVGVEIHLGTIDPMKWAQGMTRDNFEGIRPSILDTRKNNGSINADTLLLTGNIDEISIEHSQNGSILKAKGRDQRGFLIDSPVDPRMLSKIKLGKSIDDVISQIINMHPIAGSFLKNGKIKIQATDEWTQGVPTVANNTSLTRVNLGAAGLTPQVPSKGDVNDLKFWDLITQFCFLVGAVPYFVGPILLIRPAWSLYDYQGIGKYGTTLPTPFIDGKPRKIQTASGIIDQRVRLLGYGADISKLSFSRKLGGTKVPTIEVVSIDTSSAKKGAARVVTAQYPPKSGLANGATSMLASTSTSITSGSVGSEKTKVDEDQKKFFGLTTLRPSKASKAGSERATNVSPNGAAAQEEVLRFSIPGINDANQLLQIAKALHQEIGRQEITGSISTRNLCSFGGSNQDPDLLKLRVGEPIEIVTAVSRPGFQPPVVAEAIEHSSRSAAAEAAVLSTRLGSDTLAQAVVNAMQHVQRSFRVKNIKFDWNHESGVGIDIDFENYVEIRYGGSVI